MLLIVIRLETLLIPEEGLSIHLRGYGFGLPYSSSRLNMAALISFQQIGKIQPVKALNASPTYAGQLKFTIEIKQTCGIERCQARTSRAQRNPAWVQQHKRRLTVRITLYQQNWNIIKNAIRKHIKLLLQAIT